MSTPPQRPLDALGLARSGAVIECDFPIAKLPRLREMLAAPTGTAHAQVAFRQAGRRPAASLAVKAGVMLTCQRCLGPLQRVIESASQLVFAEEDAAELPEEHDAVAGDPQQVDLAALVEDELLLALPIVARHRAGEACTLAAATGPVRAMRPQPLRRPFAGLKDLLKH
jgi:DUF177 domain-containing protein